MALKPDRDILTTDISHFMPTTGTRGGFVVATGTVPSGAALDQGINQVHYIANPSGRQPMGMLGVDVVSIDLNRQPLNFMKSEVNVNDKVVLYTAGWAVTNLVDTPTTVSVGQKMYLAGSGFVTNVSLHGRPELGRFLTAADEDGYYKVTWDMSKPTVWPTD